MKRKLTLLLAVSMVVLLSACQSESSQSDRDSADNILQEDVGQTESENVREELTVGSGEGNLS